MSTANSSGLQIRAERRRKSTHVVTIGEADGDDVVIAANDNVRVKIARGNGTPLLEIESDQATSAGSSCTAANPTEIEFAAADLTFPAGIYDVEVAVVDTSDADAILRAEKGIFILNDSPGGAVD